MSYNLNIVKKTFKIIYNMAQLRILKKYMLSNKDYFKQLIDNFFEKRSPEKFVYQ